MTQDFLPVPDQLPPVPDGIEPILLLGSIGNQHAGCGMFGRAEGSTLTELQRCCEKHLPTYIWKAMPLSTATHTRNKIKYHWRWRSTGVSCNAISTGEIRGGEPVYRIVADLTHAHEGAPRTIDAVKKTTERSSSESQGSTVNRPPNEPTNARIEGIDFAPTTVHAADIVQAMLAFIPPPDFSQKNAKASHLDSWGLSREVADLILNDPNAFLIGSIFDYQIPFRKAWEAPFKLKQRLGHLDVPLIASMKYDDLFAAIYGGGKGQSLHRFNSVLTNRVISACRQLVAEYEGTAANIWPNRTSAAVVMTRLEKFDGISQKIGNMMLRLLGTSFGVHLTEWNAIDIAVDRHVERVFRRTGLIENTSHQTKRLVIQRARDLCPDFPGKLDDPAFNIGEKWCNEQRPLCDEVREGRVCPISQVCKRVQI
jgi:endonuclease-3